MDMLQLKTRKETLLRRIARAEATIRNASIALADVELRIVEESQRAAKQTETCRQHFEGSACTQGTPAA